MIEGMDFMGRRIGCVVLGLGLAAGSSALAQTPRLTTPTYDDWTVRCETVEAGKTCEIEQTSQVQGQPLSQIAIGRPSKGEAVRIVFQVPINVWLPTGVSLIWDDKDPGIGASFKRCVGGGCFADADLSDGAIKKLRARTEKSKLVFKDAAQREVTVPVSFKGFDTAFDAMAKE
jgi:invasion protein IalB